MTTTLYLSPRYTDDSQALWKAALKLGWDVQRLQWNEMDLLAPGAIAPVVYGENIFTAMSSERLKVKLFEPPSTFLLDLQRKYDMTCHLNRKYPEEKKEEKDFLLRRVYNYQRFNPPEDGVRVYIPDISAVKPLFNPEDPPRSFLHSPKFVKPVEKGQFVPGIFNDPITYIEQLPNNTEVIVSEPVEWNIEFRTFISGRKVKTISPYSRKGELVEQASALEWEQAEAFANQVANLFEEPFVIDVGYIPQRGWAVVEANAAWGSGIYGCDAIEALKVIKESCQCY